MGIPAAGQHAYGFAGPGELLQELSEGALGVRGDVVVAHGEQAGDRAREGAQQALRPSRATATATGTADPARAARANGRPRAGSGARVGGAGGTGGASFQGAARARELGLEGAPLGGGLHRRWEERYEPEAPQREGEAPQVGGEITAGGRSIPGGGGESTLGGCAEKVGGASRGGSTAGRGKAQQLGG